jgi:hypothetical protein
MAMLGGEFSIEHLQAHCTVIRVTKISKPELVTRAFPRYAQPESRSVWLNRSISS